MIFVWAFFLTAAVFGSANGAVPRIVGGDITSITNYPSLVQVEFRNVLLWWNQNCAGNLITSQYVLSAAHCFSGRLFSVNQRRIRAGANIRESGGFVIDIVRAFNHPTYRNNRFEGDITVLLLEQRLNLNNGISTAVLPPQGLEVPDNEPVTLVGWGTMWVKGGGPQSDNLRHVGVLSINNGVCATRYREWRKRPSDVSSKMLCSGLLDVSERDACSGDEGGPVYYNGTLVGIISWGYDCANAFYPRVNTKVSAYSNWIAQTIAP